MKLITRTINASWLLFCGLLIFCGSAWAGDIPSLQPAMQITDGLQAPSRIAVDAAGNLYVADTRAGAVLKYNSDGELSDRYDQVPLNGHGVAVTPAGDRLYISDDQQIWIIDPRTSELLGFIGDDLIARAGRLALDDLGYLFVADTEGLIVKVINVITTDQGLRGELFYQFAANNLASIFTLAVDTYTDEVYVPDNIDSNSYGPWRVEVYGLDGEHKRTLSGSTSFVGTIAPFVNSITFDDNGLTYIVDRVAHQLQILENGLNHLTVYGEEGHEPGQLFYPRDIAYLPGSTPGQGKLFIACSDARVEVLTLADLPTENPTNTAPSIPIPVSPVVGQESDSLTPLFTWENSEDAELDALTYLIRVYQNGVQVDELSIDGTSDAQGTATAANSLLENGEYQWAIQASDGQETSDFSDLQTFYVNAVQEPPTVVTLLSPADNTTVDGNELFSWTVSTDADPYDILIYRLQVAATADFSTILAEQTMSNTEQVLSTLTDYSALVDGQNYWWRIISEDNHGVADTTVSSNQFVYDTTKLDVTVSIPGAQVYLGGDYGYSGQKLGEAPIALKDISAVPFSIVIERAGFEPYVAQFNPLAGENLNLHAELKPALIPESATAISVISDRWTLIAENGATPFVIDWDRDGKTDLLIGEENGDLTLYRQTSRSRVYRMDGGELLASTQIVGAAPFVADWNNDGLNDLLVGGSGGDLSLMLNSGTDQQPIYNQASYLQSNQGVISVASNAIPLVTDWNDDGNKDLLIGSGDGKLHLFLNIGSDSEPAFDDVQLLLQSTDAVSPQMVDWDGDGTRELLVATGSDIYRTQKMEDGTLTLVAPLLDETLKDSKETLGQRVRFAAYDTDGRGRKDLFLGNEKGRLYWLPFSGNKPVPALIQALSDKADQLNTLAAAQDNTRLAGMASIIQSKIDSSEFRYAKVLTYQFKRQATGELATAAGALYTLLRPLR